MPPPRKVDLLPSELKAYLQEALKARGFAGYEELADELNFKLEEAGLELRIGKSALHSFGQEYAEFVKLQEASSAWAAEWMNENGLEEEAQRHNVLFQMVTTLAFKVMQRQMTKDADKIDPKELHFIGRMLKDVMASSGMREKLVADERERVARAAREDAAESVEKSAKALGLTRATVQGIKAQILGVEA